ncbi:MAG: hemin ABC transporter substrate-binding protein [Myxococcota bacterium]
MKATAVFFSAMAFLLSAQAEVKAGKERIITLGSSVTEIVYALGHGDNLVATDITSVYPKQADALPKLGHFRQLSAEGVLSLEPSLIIAVDGVGPPEVVASIKRSGVKWVSVPSGHTLTDLKKKFAGVARALGRTEAGEALFTRVESKLDPAEPKAGSPRVLFVYARGRGAMNVSGTNTAAATMIEWAGATNAVTLFEGYRPLTAEAVIAAQPDVILVTTRGLESLGGVDGLMRAPGVSLTPAGRSKRFIAIEDLKLLGFGPRVGDGVAELKQALADASKR